MSPDQRRLSASLPGPTRPERSPRVRLRSALVLAVAFVLLGPLVLTDSNDVDALPVGIGATARAQPDVVLILTDDQRPDSLLAMPNVRRLLVNRGTRFTDAHVPNSLCCPSRSSILTGLYSHDTGVWTNAGRDGGWSAFVKHGNEQHTIAVAMQRAGYRTALIGKYLNNFDNYAPPGYSPMGWSDFEGFRVANRSGAYYNYRIGSSPTRHGWGPGDYSTDVLAHRAVNFIWSTPQDQSLFLYFSTYAPHAPSTPAPRDIGVLRGKLPSYHPASVTAPVDGKPAWVQRRRQVPQRLIDQTRERHGESLMAVDDAVGAILAALQHSDRLRDTLIVFMSDNGYMTGEHHILGKSAPYEAATSVPLVIRWDGRVAPGAVDHRLAANIDLAATFADAGGARMRTEGLSLLRPRRRSGLLLEASFSTAYHRPSYCGWRTKRWLFTHYASGEEELYSVRDDPQELDNLAGDAGHAAVLSDLRARTQAACSPMPPQFHW